MAAPTRDEYTRVDEGNFVIEYAQESDTVAGAPGTYESEGCIVGDPSFTDNYDEETDDDDLNWCELTEIVDGWNETTLGKRNGALDLVVDMILGSSVQQKLESDYLAKKDGFLKVTATNVGGTESKVLYDVKVKTPQFTPAPRGQGRSRRNIRHVFVASRPSGGWPTA